MDAESSSDAAAAASETAIPFIPRIHPFIKDDEMIRLIIQWLNSRGLR
jgi:hypothetical protein